MHSRATRTGVSERTDYSLGARLVLSVGIVGCIALEVISLLRLFTHVEVGTLVPLLAGLSLGIALADFLTAMVHWACDTWGSEQTPWLGHGLIHGFREHHRDPAAMVDHDWVEVNGEAAMAGFLALVVFNLFPASYVPGSVASLGSWAHVFSVSLFLSLTGVSAFTNQLHYWAHATKLPGIVRRLQRAGLILSPVKHARHHRSPHLHGYCISTGWLNRPMDAMHFWRGLEKCLTALSGIEPRKDI